jgi:hypothetical protein
MGKLDESRSEKNCEKKSSKIKIYDFFKYWLGTFWSVPGIINNRKKHT